MGYCYYQQQNYHEAYKWLLKASERGHARAQYYLGTTYVVGLDGVPADTKQAFYWIDKAALNGVQDAFNYIKRLYYLFEPYMTSDIRDQYKYHKKRTNV